MSTSVNLFDAGLYYRVNHPEFRPDAAYRAICYIDYGESAWSQLLFVTGDGKTYCVKVHRCLCLNSIANGNPEDWLDLSGEDNPLWTEIADRDLVEAPWPKPKCKNPDLDDD